MLDEPVGRDPRQRLVGVVDALPPLIEQRERQRVGDPVGSGWA